MSFAVLSAKTPLVYPDISGINQYINILLIDSQVPDYQIFVTSVNASTLPIVYSIYSQKSDLLALLQANFTTIPRIGLCFNLASSDTNIFLDSKPLFVDDDLVTNTEQMSYSDNLQFILDIITEFQVQNVDYLACNTLNYPNWTNYYAILTNNTGVTVGASSDQTGNIKYGGDWVLESTNEDVELIYFTQSIEYYSYLLDVNNWYPPSSIVSFASDNTYLYASSGTNSVTRILISNPTSVSSFPITGLTSLGQMDIYNNKLYVVDSVIGIVSIPISTLNSYTTFATDGSGISHSQITQMGVDSVRGFLYAANYTSTAFVSRHSLTNPADYQASWVVNTGTPNLNGAAAGFGIDIDRKYLYALGNSSQKVYKVNMSYPISDYTVDWFSFLSLGNQNPQNYTLRPSKGAYYNGYLYSAFGGAGSTSFNAYICKIKISDPTIFKVFWTGAFGSRINDLKVYSDVMYVTYDIAPGYSTAYIDQISMTNTISGGGTIIGNGSLQ